MVTERTYCTPKSELYLHVGYFDIYLELALKVLKVLKVLRVLISTAAENGSCHQNNNLIRGEVPSSCLFLL